MVQIRKKKIKQKISKGVVHIYSSYNNTIVTITDLTGNTYTWTSAGSVGFKGTRKGTSYAAQVASEKAALKAMEYGIQKVDVVVRGLGPGRETAIRALAQRGLKLASLKDINSIPYNGCRPPKRRRI